MAVCLGAAPPPVFDKNPPGTIVQDVVGYLSGEGMNSAWRIVVSRQMVGRQMGKDPAYQYYISFYAPASRGYRLAYQLPNGSGVLLSRVRKAHGAQLYFPYQSVHIVGTGEFEQSGVQDVVIASKEFAADCGTADVTVFGADSHLNVEQRVHVSNSCQLQAAIVGSGDRNSVRLTGPYYNSTAAMCCPTKPRAYATLAYKHGAWQVNPNYYIISASLAAHHPQ
ncbi:MAG TPA: hypothetical protein VFE17_01180 [Candidatus Baltobacteraceae bacterium]|nr:hypothetical protein [Candidatus Baltobacteraceae bacterium]